MAFNRISEFKTMVLVVFLIKTVIGEGDDVVMTPRGPIRGLEMETYNGKRFIGFHGIPYAKPPVGELRFDYPYDTDDWRWDDTRDGTVEPPMCMQFDMLRRQIDGSEDCLYLNVYTNNTRPLNLKSVMVFIHGGDFSSGSPSTMARPNKIMQWGNIVFVTVQYRLGAFGFLTTGDDIIPPNLGLWDIIAALKWILVTIEHFGGNPDSVTLFGEGSGAALVSLLLFTPHTKDLIHRVIMQSGNTLVPWYMQNDTVQWSQKLAMEMDCPYNDSHDMTDCLLDKSAHQILEQFLSLTERKTLAPIPFTPIVDYKLIMDNPAQLLWDGLFHKVPILLGCNDNEGGLMNLVMNMNGELTEDFDENLNNILTTFLNVNDKTIRQKKIEEVKKFYGKKYSLSNPDQAGILIEKILGDSMQVTPMYKFAILAARKMKNSVFAYIFAHRGEKSFGDMYHADVGVTHGDELRYLFDIPPLKWGALNEEDYEISRAVVAVWVSFALTGLPNPTYQSWWEPVDINEFNYMNFTKELEMGRLDLSRVDMWMPLNDPFIMTELRVKDEL